MSQKEKLSKLLRMTGMNAKYQDGRVLLYNRDPQHLSSGVSVNGIPAAVQFSQAYLSFLRSSGFMPVTEFADDYGSRVRGEIDFRTVQNRVEPQSSYFVSGMSSLSRINLLKAASELTARVQASRELRKLGVVGESTMRRHKKIKRIASIYREDSEKIC